MEAKVKEIKNKYNCTEAQAINIVGGLNTPEQLNLKVVKVKLDAKLDKAVKGKTINKNG